MSKKLKIPGFGNVEIDLQPSEYAQTGKLFIQRMQEHFFVVRHRPTEEPSDIQLVKALKEVLVIQREEGVKRKKIEETRKLLSRGTKFSIGGDAKENGRLVQ
jgi:hypothetical protein